MPKRTIDSLRKTKILWINIAFPLYALTYSEDESLFRYNYMFSARFSHANHIDRHNIFAFPSGLADVSPKQTFRIVWRGPSISCKTMIDDFCGPFLVLFRFRYSRVRSKGIDHAKHTTTEQVPYSNRLIFSRIHIRRSQTQHSICGKPPIIK